MAARKKVTRRKEILIKGVHFILRQFSMSPELCQARRIQRGAFRAINRRGLLANRKILIPTMRDWASHVHLEALLGQYLRSEGATVRHISCGGGLEICDRANTWESPPMPCHSCSKYVKVSLKAHQSEVSWLNASWGPSDWPELDTMSLSELMSVSWGSYDLGRLVEVPVKWFLLSESLGDDPLGRQTYRSFLRSARNVVAAVEAEFDRDPPDQVVLLNGLFMFEAVIWEVARRRGIPVVSYERAFIVDSFVFAHDRVSSYYQIDEIWSLEKSIPLTVTQSKELDDYMVDRRFGLRTTDDYWARVSSLGAGDSQPGLTAVLFTNVVWDSAVIGQDLAFPSIVEWIVAAVQTFSKHPNHNLIIRIHPAEEKLSGRESRERMDHSLARSFPALPPNVRVIPPEDDTSSYELMAESDLGLVYTSTAGLEMALVGKPVVVAARTHYRGKGFTVDVSTSEEFEGAIEDFLLNSGAWSSNLDLARRYAHLFFFRTPYFSMGISEPMRGLVEFESDSLDSLLRSGRGDVRRFIDAVATGRSFDFSGE